MHFGLNSLPDIKPRILVWRGNKVKQFSELDKNNSRSYGKRPLKRLSPSLYAPVSLFFGMFCFHLCSIFRAY